jgi:transcriptional regulator with XRE-family HTH domain
MPNGEALALGRVGPRPVFFEELGAFFRALREDRGLGLRQAAEIAKGRGLSAVTRQALFALEKGRTKDADPDVLRGVAELYGTEYALLVSAVVEAKYGVSPRALLVGLPQEGAKAVDDATSRVGVPAIAADQPGRTVAIRATPHISDEAAGQIDHLRAMAVELGDACLRFAGQLAPTRGKTAKAGHRTSGDAQGRRRTGR